MAGHLRYIWTSPNTLIGLLILPVALARSGNVQVVDGVIELYGPVVSWILRRCPFVPGGALAMTLGHVVWGRDIEALAATRVHERAHVRQYERWGPAFIPVYILSSLWGLASGAGLYFGNRFEREALEWEARRSLDRSSAGVRGGQSCFPRDLDGREASMTTTDNKESVNSR